ncbi:ANL_HP_G0102940.mRNA.1.CDS.1 [Saccharomyces cerevisiae]|nr:ANL_HP_G0046900.mRNA.1.CDS.1 [Saccharomyces cerevisiae]CAI5076676.1 ANL_HP_G0098070.mRNA.1.CDS.1 [Saccharomyces cerevisiae]CAI5091308.1 ANL_HP_G0102940.mRNA.1.CDS.1 [Saccharomyces cerevisiae]CAI6859807.1 ANL_HP_G0046900.mRNA.1.CDS.1 [Saccharomyces cerevisiae]CAI6966714.1 ANL_HP_G0098070.mRNA.1.CDS.1 [Saccharomyces cerevisiae]
MIKATPLTAQKSGYFTVISDSVPAPPLLQDTPVCRYISLVVPSGQEILLMSAEPRIQNFRSTHHCLSLQCKAMVLVLSQVGGSSRKTAPKRKIKVTYIVLLLPIHCCPSHLIFFHK